MHKIVIKRKKKLETYSSFEDIPSDFDHVIKCELDIPPEPHTPEQHEEIHRLHEEFNRLMEKENRRDH